MKIIECVQGSPEWFAVRCGVPTASNFDRIINLNGKRSAQRQKYLYQLAGERITKVKEELYQNAIMQRGSMMEGEARKEYELISCNPVRQVGFCIADEGYGTSPDGLIDDLGGLEIKCPMMATHVSYLLNGELPSDYFQQVQGNLLVTGRKWWDFMSYYPNMKPLLVRVKRDEKFLSQLKIELDLFCAELDEVVKKIGG